MVQLFFLGLGKLISLCNSVYIIKLLGAEKIGVSTLMQSYTNLSSIGYDFALNEIILKSQKKDNENQLFINAIIFRLLIAIALGIVIFFLARLIIPLEGEAYLIGFLVFAILKNSIDPLIIYRNSEKMELYYIIGIISPIMVSVIYLSMNKDRVFTGLDFISVHATMFIGNLILLGAWLKNITEIKVKIKPIVELIRNNWAITLGSMVHTLTFSFQIIIAGMLLNLEDLGVMRASMILVLPLELAYSVMQNKTFIYLKSLVGRDDSRDVIFKTARRSLLVYGIGIILLMLIPESFFSKILGYDYRYNHEFFIIVGVGKLILIIMAPISLSMYLLQGRGAILNSSVVMFIVMLLTTVLTYYFSLVGLALSMVIVDLTLPLYGFWGLKNQQIESKRSR
jgi:O-antigen/teichoic acid export membrane protein